MSMLELKNLSFEVPSCDGTKKIIDNINLTVEDGKFAVITGPNGGGKSTLAKLIMGIEKPTSGKILFNGTDVTEMSISERANLGISFAFQQPVRFKGLMPTCQNQRASVSWNSSKSFCVNGEIVGTPVEPDDVEINTTSFSSTAQSSPKNEPTP